GRIGAGGGLGEHATDRGERRGGQGARGGCRRRRAPSTRSASMAMRRFLLVRDGRALASAWEQVTARQDCDGSQPGRVGQAADQASGGGQADAGTSAESSQLKAAQRAP